MGCRCSEIAKLNREIEKLNDALSFVKQAYSNSENTKRNIINVGNHFESGLLLNGKQEYIATDLRRSYNNAIASIEEASSDVLNAISEAERELSEAESEDSDYHSKDDDDDDDE